MPICYDCGGPATERYDLGPDHGYWMGWRYIHVCAECKAERDDAETPVREFDESLALLRERKG